MTPTPDVPRCFRYSSQFPYSGGYAEIESRITKIYSSVVVSTDTPSTLNECFRSNLNSRQEWDIFSNPMKAQGVISEIATTWENISSSGIKDGRNVKTALSRYSSAVPRQNVMPRVKVSASSTIRRTACRSLFIHRRPVSRMIPMVRMTSPA